MTRTIQMAGQFALFVVSTDRQPFVSSPLLEPVAFDVEEMNEILGFLLDQGFYVIPAPPRFEGDLLPGWLLGTHGGDAHVREEEVHFGHVAAQAFAAGYANYRKTKLFRERMAIAAVAGPKRSTIWEDLLL